MRKTQIHRCRQTSAFRSVSTSNRTLHNGLEEARRGTAEDNEQLDEATASKSEVGEWKSCWRLNCCDVCLVCCALGSRAVDSTSVVIRVGSILPVFCFSFCTSLSIIVIGWVAGGRLPGHTYFDWGEFLRNLYGSGWKIFPIENSACGSLVPVPVSIVRIHDEKLPGNVALHTRLFMSENNIS